MTLYEQILAAIPELTSEDFGLRGSIELQNDSDSAGDYIAKWNYTKPIPEGLKLGK
jgi:hypothetical protein